jgi:hypothetical protein
MKIKQSNTLAALILTALLLAPPVVLHAAEVANLRCEYLEKPLGIDVAKPRLSWGFADSKSGIPRGQQQTAYQVLVASAEELLKKDTGDFWDSGKVASVDSQQIPYQGKPLGTAQACYWKVRFWDQTGKVGPWSDVSSWTMGVISSDDWKANWIGTSKAGRKARGYHAGQTARADDPKWVQVDLGRSQPLASIRLHPQRHEGKDGFGFPVRFKVEAANDPDFKEPTLIADLTAADFPNPGLNPVAFDAKGSAARYVRVTATKLGKFTPTSYCFALSQLEVVADGRNVAKNAQVTALDSVEDFGWGKVALTDGVLGVAKAASKATATVMLRREFTVKPGLRRALVNVCGLGEYEMTLNAIKVGEDMFPSGWTLYRKTCLYDTHDITAKLRTGANDLQLLLGNGMYNVSGEGGRYRKFNGSFGPPKAIAQVRLDYADGTTETIGTDESWQASPGPITFSCVYGGEDYDAAWKPQWEPAKIVTGPGGALKGLSCAAPPIRTFDVLKSTKLNETVFDLGQNVSLMPRLTVKGPAGATVKITPSELITPSGDIDDAMCAGKNYWSYTLAGTGTETYFPKFYYRGARYLKVECTGGAEIVAIEGVVVHSSAAPVGEFSCSNELFNRIRNLVRWAQRSNMMSVLTDCPHREKFGWLEEYHLNGPSLRYHFDLATLYTKAMNDMADSQLENGLVPSIAPEYPIFGGGFRDSPEWGSSVVQVPWQQYEFNGDLALLRRYYDEMERYVAYIGSKAKDHIVDYGLGDWYDIGPKPPGQAQLTPKALTATAIYYDDVNVLAKTAKLLGRDDDTRRYEALAGEIRLAFHAKFPELPASQTGRAMPLVVGLVEPAQRQAVLDALVSDVQQKGLTAGDVGYRYLLRALADGGRSDVIFAMNNQSEKPGYGCQLRNGATSLTEAWDARRSSSQNHFMMGQIIEWFYHDLAGIQPDPTAPGFKNTIIKPAIVGDLTWVKCYYDSSYGRIVSNWKRVGDKLTMDATIPANTTATVYVPAKDAAAVAESGKPADKADGVKFLRMENNAAVFAVGSGTYQFQSTMPENIK